MKIILSSLNAGPEERSRMKTFFKIIYIHLQLPNSQKTLMIVSNSYNIQDRF